MSASLTLTVPAACAPFVALLKKNSCSRDLEQSTARGQQLISTFFYDYVGELDAYSAAQDTEEFFVLLDKYNIPHSVEILDDKKHAAERHARLIGDTFLVKKIYDNEYSFSVNRLTALMATGKLNDAIAERAEFLKVAPWETQSEHVKTWRTWYLIDPTGESCERIAREPQYCPRSVEQS